ncbi:MAG: histidinol dehydrogenase [Betaproteobacteria bacterium]|nr:histidinol dehydrogenase [Betaproteobacteria bacterium]
MLEVSLLRSDAPGFDAALGRLLAFEASLDEGIESAVRAILADVKSRGDQAVLDYTRRFDGVAAQDMGALCIPKAELEAAFAGLPHAQRDALVQAAGRIRSYHERQVQESWSFTDGDGNKLGQKVTALERVGLYVPGGKAAYPSTVMMNALPAKVAGVARIIMVVPTPGGNRNALVLAAAALCGVDQVYAIGGAQAIGALAYGTTSIPQADKIVGPGNAYVASAKRQVFGTVGIDMLAGPSEILVLSDGTGNPDWVAMDLFSQAEHDEVAQAVLLCPDANFIDAVHASMARQIHDMPRAGIIRKSLKNRGALIQVRDLNEACEIANRMAPEHLELSLADPEAWLGKIHNAGAIFLGHYASEALGDYCAGPNHVLPTARTARFSSPLGVYDFQKRTSIIQVSREGADKLGRVASELARGEGLPAHAKSAEYRLHH